MCVFCVFCVWFWSVVSLDYNGICAFVIKGACEAWEMRRCGVETDDVRDGGGVFLWGVCAWYVDSRCGMECAVCVCWGSVWCCAIWVCVLDRGCDVVFDGMCCMC